VERLRELGWNDGRTIAIEYRWWEGHPERDAEIAAELARLKANVILTSDRAALSIRQTISPIPIVFVLAFDPVGQGLVENLARPGRNITGVAAEAIDAVGKSVLNGKKWNFCTRLSPGFGDWGFW
jgi:putative ABC transport system substrate-binding protein